MNNQQIYSPQGIINHSNESQFQEQLLRFIEQSTKKDVIVDFKDVDFVDSSGLIALVNAYREAKRQHKNFYIFNVSPSVKMIFEISRLDQVLGINRDSYEQILREDAIAA